MDEIKVSDLMHEALMCSVFVSPNDPGLSYEEIKEIARRFDFKNGEIDDTAKIVLSNSITRDRYVPNTHYYTMMKFTGEEPSLINYNAIDFIYRDLNEQIREVGVAKAKIDRNVLVERAVRSGFTKQEVEAAITVFILEGSLKQDKANIEFSSKSGKLSLIGEMVRNNRDRVYSRPSREKVLTAVKDVIARRSDDRQSKADPLDAFPEALEQIGLKDFRMWWTQTTTELRSSDPNSTPVSCVVLAAALTEAALIFTAKYSRENNLGAFQSNNFDGEPKNWKVEKLIESAAQGGPAAILTAPLRSSAEHLNKTRQRVHAGRMLVDYPGGPPDLRPEEGRNAKAIAEDVTRAVLDWLGRHPIR